MAYLLDTNVISELRKEPLGRCHPLVSDWAETADFSQAFLSVITVMELELGVKRAEHGQRDQAGVLRQWLEDVLTAFDERVIDIDAKVARRCSALHVPDPAPERDALIAASALEHDLVVVTRNVSDFMRTGVRVINPWE